MLEPLCLSDHFFFFFFLHAASAAFRCATIHNYDIRARLRQGTGWNFSLLSLPASGSKTTTSGPIEGASDTTSVCRMRSWCGVRAGGTSGARPLGQVVSGKNFTSPAVDCPASLMSCRVVVVARTSAHLYANGDEDSRKVMSCQAKAVLFCVYVPIYASVREKCELEKPAAEDAKYRRDGSSGKLDVTPYETSTWRRECELGDGGGVRGLCVCEHTYFLW